MLGSKSQLLPFQPMLGDGQITLRPCNSFQDEDAFAPHRHNFYMLLWTTRGTGKHYIDFCSHKITPGQCYFLHMGQVHQMESYPTSGWTVLFSEAVFRQFLKDNPQQEQTGLFDIFNRAPVANLNAEILNQLDNMCSWIASPGFDESLPKTIFYNYLSIILMLVNHMHVSYPIHPVVNYSIELTRNFKILIEQYFKIHREVTFYSKKLSVPSRKLNASVRHCLGKTASELICCRLLSESQVLLGGTSLSIKEVSYELGFSDQAYFGRFFKKFSGKSPSAFRDQYAKLS